MKPGEGGQVAPSLPGSGQTCLESQGRTRSSNPPTRSHLTRPAASPLHRARRPPAAPAPAGPPARPPASPPAPLLIHLARTAQTAQAAHTARLRAESEPEAAGTPRTPPTEAAAPRSRSAHRQRLSGSSDSEQASRRELRGPLQDSPRPTLSCRQERTVAPARSAMERIPSAQPPPACLSKAPGLEPGDLPG